MAGSFAPMPTMAPMPTIAPLPAMAPMPAMPTLAPLPGVGDVMSSLAPLLTTLAPALLSTIAPDAVDSATSIAGQAAKNVMSNMSKGVTAITDAAGNATAAATGKSGSLSIDAKKDTGGFMETVKPFIIPILGLVIGSAMMQVESVNAYGKLVLYFGAQSFMNIFMSWALGTHVTVPAGTTLRNGHVLATDLKGCPAGFLLTALQQIVSFLLFLVFFAVMYPTKNRYMPKHLKTNFEYISVVVFGCVFAANIALNNFSLGYISIGVNLIIRSCLPLTTYLSQQGLSLFGLYPRKDPKVLEIALMCLGVVCACVFTWADFRGKLTLGGRFIGVLGCLGSLLCGSLNLALAGVLGETKLNVLDTCAYMAIPAVLFLCPIIFFVSKPLPGEWTHIGHSMTDWQIVQETWYYSRSTIFWMFVSGFFSFMYNIVQFTIVHTLSPSATAFGGNFNKAALTFMTLLLPFLQTKANPPMPYIAWEWTALVVNIYAFTHYGYLQVKAKQEAAERALKGVQDDDSSDEENSSGSDE